ncbi:MFS transporter [Parvularcula maris]|uniref:MFS transporter n=1 Tax=Parvularcula maris TaxID=2965077 RepID=A0A9X2RKY8_9PROT|nr:MFS transporter [Parvularcula maris]MCQ8186273.1 MFS transporter [Parvularcula maris]
MADVTSCTDPARTRPASKNEARPCAKSDRKWVLTAAILASALGFIEGSVVTLAVPAIRQGLGASFAEIQWIMNGYLLMLGAFILPAGGLGDRFGQRDVILVGIVVFIATSVWCGLAQSPEELIAARVVKGAGAALMVPGSLALIAKNFPKEERGAAIGLWSGASAVTTALGPVLGGAILQGAGEEGWRMIFFLNVPLGALAVLVLLKVPRDEGRPERKIDLPGGVLAALMLGSLAYALTVLGEEGGRVMAAVGFLGFAAALAALLAAEHRSPSPMMPLGLFASKSFSGANLLTLLLYLALGGVLFFAPMTLIEMHGLSEGAAGLLFVPFSLVIAAASRLTGGWADKVGFRLPLTLGPVVAAIGFALVGFFIMRGAFYVGVLPSMAFLGLGMGIAVPPLGAAVMASVPDDRVGVASGINNGVSRVSQLLAVAALGLLASLAFRASLPEGAGAADFGEGREVLPAEAFASAMGAGFTAITAAAVLLSLLAAATAFLTQDGRPPANTAT